MKKGLMVFVYKAGHGDTTNGGISSRFDKVTMVSDEYEVPEIFDANENTLKLVIRNVCGRSFPILVPLDSKEAGGTRYYMFGGNFAYTSDSRFPHDAPIKIFDRNEG